MLTGWSELTCSAFALCVCVCVCARACQWLVDLMDATAKREKLRSFEMVKRIHVCGEDFTVENGLLTPTLKVTRRAHTRRTRKRRRIEQQSHCAHSQLVFCMCRVVLCSLLPPAAEALGGGEVLRRRDREDVPRG